MVPNTFTPNGDGVNDVLRVLADMTIPVRHFTVFNRWGQVVFRTTDISRFWDGSRGGEKVPEGVYFWKLESRNKEYDRSGWVTVTR